jgi:hypothetical protein
MEEWKEQVYRNPPTFKQLFNGNGQLTASHRYLVIMATFTGQFFGAAY